MSQSDLVQLEAGNFEQEVLKADLPVLVDFWAPWCAPCRMVGPIVEELANEYAGKVKVAKLNTDEHPDIARRYGVMSIPTLILYRGGQVLDTIIGAQPKPDLKTFIQSALTIQSK